MFEKDPEAWLLVNAFLHCHTNVGGTWLFGISSLLFRLETSKTGRNEQLSENGSVNGFDRYYDPEQCDGGCEDLKLLSARKEL